MESRSIDMVVVNLYQFEKYANRPGITREELLENIDIGGPTMIRAAAKNFQDVAVIVSPDQYEAVLSEIREFGGALGPATHWNLAQRAFLHTAAYDMAVSNRLMQIDATGAAVGAALPVRLQISVERAAVLRYGENPHQQAALYTSGEAGIAGAEQLHGKELSYNNLVDLDAAWQLVQEFAGSRIGNYQTHESVRLRGTAEIGGSIPQGAGSRSCFRLRRCARV